MSPMAQTRLALGRYRTTVDSFWQARSEQERKFLKFGAVALVLMLVYGLLIDPALSGRAQLRRDLPLLRQQAAEIQALALQAGTLARTPAAQVPPMSKESLTASLAARGLTAQSVAITGEFAKLQFKGAPFASLMAWFDAMRREGRITVQDSAIVAQPVAGLVDATITLHQNQGGGR